MPKVNSKSIAKIGQGTKESAIPYFTTIRHKPSSETDSNASTVILDIKDGNVIEIDGRLADAYNEQGYVGVGSIKLKVIALAKFTGLQICNAEKGVKIVLTIHILKRFMEQLKIIKDTLEIAELGVPGFDEKIHLSSGVYACIKSEPFSISIRKYWYDKESNSVLPTKVGVYVGGKDVNSFLNALTFFSAHRGLNEDLLAHDATSHDCCECNWETIIKGNISRK